VGHGVHELVILLSSAEAHHALNACPVVPAAVEEDKLFGERKMGHVALEIPAGALAI
jgi:hypothetical protein